MTPDEIQKVLAMPKWEQAEFLYQYTNQKPYEERSKSHWLDLAGAIDAHDAGSVTADYLLDRALSLLAFRLRDEADETEYDKALYTIHLIVNGKESCTYIRWIQTRIKPIHMILAALLAKGD